MKKWLVVATAVALVVVGSVAVWQLSDDDARRTGAVEASSEEPVLLSWRGVWSEKKEFGPGQVVQYRGVAYVAERGPGETDPWCEDECRKAAENAPPAWCPDDCRWALLAY
jgi:hypothetical protein